MLSKQRNKVVFIPIFEFLTESTIKKTEWWVYRKSLYYVLRVQYKISWEWLLFFYNWYYCLQLDNGISSLNNIIKVIPKSITNLKKK